MTPITEDQVLSLMKGLETREKKALNRLAHSTKQANNHSGMTARILGYTQAAVGYRAASETDANPVSLAQVRAVRKARRTIGGHFFNSIGAEKSPA